MPQHMRGWFVFGPCAFYGERPVGVAGRLPQCGGLRKSR